MLIITISNNTSAQLPGCVKEKCDSILRIELGEDIYINCVDYIGFECTDKLDTITDTPCQVYSRHSYLVRYKFRFPDQAKAFFRLGFTCTGFNGHMNVESEYFSRPNQSDLPQGFKEKGLKIVDYKKIARKSSRRIAKKTSEKGLMRWEGGALVLTQDKIVWIFSKKEPYSDPSGFGDEAMIVYRVWVDPYTGKIIGSQNGRE